MSHSAQCTARAGLPCLWQAQIRRGQSSPGVREPLRLKAHWTPVGPAAERVESSEEGPWVPSPGLNQKACVLCPSALHAGCVTRGCRLTSLNLCSRACPAGWLQREMTLSKQTWHRAGAQSIRSCPSPGCRPSRGFCSPVQISPFGLSLLRYPPGGEHAGVSWLLGVGYEKAQGTRVEACPALCMLTWAPGRQQLCATLKLSRILWSLPPAMLSAFCLWKKLQPKKMFNQRSEKMQKPKDTVNGDQIIIKSLSKVKDLFKGNR